MHPLQSAVEEEHRKEKRNEGVVGRILLSLLAPPAWGYSNPTELNTLATPAPNGRPVDLGQICGPPIPTNRGSIAKSFSVRWRSVEETRRKKCVRSSVSGCLLKERLAAKAQREGDAARR